LTTALELAQTIPVSELPHLLGELEEIRATAVSRLTTTVVAAPTPEDTLLDVDAAAARLKVSRDFLYRNHKNFPFTRRVGRKLFFSEQGIANHLKQPAS